MWFAGVWSSGSLVGGIQTHLTVSKHASGFDVLVWAVPKRHSSLQLAHLAMILDLIAVTCSDHLHISSLLTLRQLGHSQLSLPSREKTGDSAKQGPRPLLPRQEHITATLSWVWWTACWNQDEWIVLAGEEIWEYNGIYMCVLFETVWHCLTLPVIYTRHMSWDTWYVTIHHGIWYIGIQSLYFFGNQKSTCRPTVNKSEMNWVGVVCSVASTSWSMPYPKTAYPGSALKPSFFHNWSHTLAQPSCLHNYYIHSL